MFFIFLYSYDFIFTIYQKNHCVFLFLIFFSISDHFQAIKRLEPLRHVGGMLGVISIQKHIYLVPCLPFGRASKNSTS